MGTKSLEICDDEEDFQIKNGLFFGFQQEI